MTTHAQRAQVHATNMANLGTPGYKRQIPILSQQVQVPFADLMGQVNAAASGLSSSSLHNMAESGVTMSGTVSDPSKGTQLYMPYHPAADANGYVEASTANPLVDMADALMANRTTIVIAHRLTTAARCDRIGVVAEGRLAELGTHDELVAAQGHYASLHSAWTGAQQ